MIKSESSSFRPVVCKSKMSCYHYVLSSAKNEIQEALCVIVKGESIYN